MSKAFRTGCWAASAGVLVGILGGCGQKGPLYLPDSQGTVVTRPTQSTAPAPQQQSPQQQPSPGDGDKSREKNPR